MKARSLPLAAAAAALLALSACGGEGASEGTGGDGLTPVKVAYTPIYSAGAIKLGIDKGYFEEEGLDVELQQVANPPAGIAAVAGGQVQFNYAPSIPVINAVANGVDLKIVAGADGYAEGTSEAVQADPATGVEYDDTAVVMSEGSDITRPSDLEGKTVSVPAREAQLEVTIADAVQADGGDPSQVEWITLDFPSAVSSLQSGRVDAAGLVAPFITQATSQGGELLMSPGISFFGDGAIGLWITSAGYASSDAETVEAFQRAIERSNDYANENLEEEQQAAAELLRTDLETVQGGATPAFPTTVEVADLEDTIAKMRELGYLDKPVDASSLVVPLP